ncbi:MAG: D-alanyl-D-alanine carboxypeptidase family protein [Gammaproteobacteria bacterium]
MKKIFKRSMMLVCTFSALTIWAADGPSTPASTIAPPPATPASASAEVTPNNIAPAVPDATPIANIPKASSISNVIPTPPAVQAKAYLLLDANSGYIIAQQNANQRMAPASLTKLMTMYVLSGMLNEGRIHLTDQVTVSENAWRMGGSRMFVQVGTQVPAKDLVNGIIVASGNDACVAMAEHAAGNESSFVDLMNRTAGALGMKGTHYADATGLPNPDNYTTPFDLSILSRAIIFNYPEDYQWYSQKWTMFNNIRQPNRNLLLWRDPTVDGLKTGHTDDAGYCLVASAKRQDMRLIAIVMGDTSSRQRAVDALALLNYGYHFYETHKVYSKDAKITTLRVWYGQDKKTPLGLSRDLYVTVPIGQYEKLKATMAANKGVNAPVVKGQSYGMIEVRTNDGQGQVVGSQPLVALANNPVGGFFSRLSDHVAILFSRWFHNV